MLHLTVRQSIAATCVCLSLFLVSLPTVAAAEKCGVVTVATNLDYALAAMALGQSFIDIGSNLPRTVLVPEDVAPVDSNMHKRLEIAGWKVVFVKVIDNPAQILRQHWKKEVFTKFHAFQVFDYETIIFLDADTIVSQKINSLCTFLRPPYRLAARPEYLRGSENQSSISNQYLEEATNITWTLKTFDIRGQKRIVFNSGVMVIRPETVFFNDLMRTLEDEVTRDGNCIGSAGCNDQRILNIYFDGKVQYLPTMFNIPASPLKLRYEHQRLESNGIGPVIYHYYGRLKPWNNWKANWKSVLKEGATVTFGNSLFSYALDNFQRTLVSNNLTLLDIEDILPDVDQQSKNRVGKEKMNRKTTQETMGDTMRPSKRESIQSPLLEDFPGMVAEEEMHPAKNISGRSKDIVETRKETERSYEKRDLSERIVGGEEVIADAQPRSVVFLEARNWDRLNGRGTCTGTLIGSHSGSDTLIMLTAAHCIIKNGMIGPQEVTVKAGCRNYTGGRCHHLIATTWYIHPEYASKTSEGRWILQNKYADIAVVALRFAQVNSNPEFLLEISVMNADPQFVSPDDNVLVMGWGERDQLNDTNSNDDGKLHLVELSISSVAQASDWDAMGKISDNPALLFRGDSSAAPAGQKDSCFGDSGGPNFIKLDNGTAVLVGVDQGGRSKNSFSCFGTQNWFPSYATSVSFHLSWVHDVLRSFFGDDWASAIPRSYGSNLKEDQKTVPYKGLPEDYKGPQEFTKCVRRDAANGCDYFQELQAIEQATGKTVSIACTCTGRVQKVTVPISADTMACWNDIPNKRRCVAFEDGSVDCDCPDVLWEYTSGCGSDGSVGDLNQNSIPDCFDSATDAQSRCGTAISCRSTIQDACCSDCDHVSKTEVSEEAKIVNASPISPPPFLMRNFEGSPMEHLGAAWLFDGNGESISISTCLELNGGLDTVLYVFEVGHQWCLDLHLITYNDNDTSCQAGGGHSSLQFRSIPGRRYLIWIHYHYVNIQVATMWLSLVSTPTAIPTYGPAGTDVTGIWQMTAGSLGSNELHCIGLNDYDLVPELGGSVPGSRSGSIPRFPRGGTQGKLHCKYDQGIMQLAIQEGSLALHGRWYSGGHADCYQDSARECKAGRISLRRSSAAFTSLWSGTISCDDDDDLSTQKYENEVTWIFNRALDTPNASYLSYETIEECAVIKSDRYMDYYVENGATLRGTWLYQVGTDDEQYWHLCVGGIDESVSEDTYIMSSFYIHHESGIFETGRVHASGTETQLLIRHKIASGCYRGCTNSGEGESLLALLYNGRLLNRHRTSEQDALTDWILDERSSLPTKCSALQALDNNPSMLCPRRLSAGANVDGTWFIDGGYDDPELGPSGQQIKCQSTNDYEHLTNGAIPDMSDGAIDSSLSANGKLQCKYSGGIIQFAIQEDSTRLHGRWYEGGHAGCWNIEGRKCYVGMIQLTRVSNLSSMFSGTWWCDDDQNPLTEAVDVFDITMSLEDSHVRDEIGRSVDFLRMPYYVAQLPLRSYFDMNNPEDGPTLRNTWASYSLGMNLAICIGSIDWGDETSSDAYKATFSGLFNDTRSLYETGIVHRSHTDIQLFSHWLVGSGCFRKCDHNLGESLIVEVEGSALLRISAEQDAATTWEEEDFLTGLDVHPYDYCLSLEMLAQNSSVCFIPPPTCDPIDQCPGDDNKCHPGACGCGYSDEDADSNGFPDCFGNIDLCPSDHSKVLPGTCGCGVSDDDTDSSGIPDCLDSQVDLCPTDANKIHPGACGCGTNDLDSNQNGVLDCFDSYIDLCPSSSSKTHPGACGCDISDADANQNGIPDCFDSVYEDLCPEDDEKPAPGVCGCGVVENVGDTDSNGVPDCFFVPPCIITESIQDGKLCPDSAGYSTAHVCCDYCRFEELSGWAFTPYVYSSSASQWTGGYWTYCTCDIGYDPTQACPQGVEDLCPEDDGKDLPGQCGCGISDEDTDSSGIPDCLDSLVDLCPSDPNKSHPGACGCNTSDEDNDSNGIPDCLDSLVDLCPSDPNKSHPGACGCGTSDEDTDSSGIPDCLDSLVDLCPSDPNKSHPGACGCGTSDEDTDSSGIPDCLDSLVDLCPSDPNKSHPGVCGCNTSDEDNDSNGIPDCLDSLVDLCPSDPNKSHPGACGCGTSDEDTDSDGIPDCFDNLLTGCVSDPCSTSVISSGSLDFMHVDNQLGLQEVYEVIAASPSPISGSLIAVHGQSKSNTLAFSGANSVTYAATSFGYLGVINASVPDSMSVITVSSAGHDHVWTRSLAINRYNEVAWAAYTYSSICIAGYCHSGSLYLSAVTLFNSELSTGLWSVKCGSMSWSWVSQLSFDIDGNLFGKGSFSSGVTCGGISPSGVGGHFYAFKLDRTNGAILWLRRYGSAQGNSLFGGPNRVTPSGLYLVASSYSSSAYTVDGITVTGNTANERSGCLICLSPTTGVAEWMANFLCTSSSCYPFLFEENSRGEIFAIGYYSGLVEGNTAGSGITASTSSVPGYYLAKINRDSGAVLQIADISYLRPQSIQSVNGQLILFAQAQQDHSLASCLSLAAGAWYLLEVNHDLASVSFRNRREVPLHTSRAFATLLPDEGKLAIAETHLGNEAASVGGQSIAPSIDSNKDCSVAVLDAPISDCWKDWDGDGTSDCHDTCPFDPFKVDDGLCGCGITDIDSNVNGRPDCMDFLSLPPSVRIIGPAAAPYATKLGGRLAADASLMVASGMDMGVLHLWNEKEKLWEESFSFSGTDTIAGDSFGSVNDLHGNIIVVGSRAHSSGRGAAYVFQYEPGNLRQIQKLQPAAEDTSRNKKFGHAVAISHSHIVVGADDHLGSFQGSAYVFVRKNMDSEPWIEEAKLIPTISATSNLQFGQSVAIDEYWIAVGSRDASNKGAVWMFRREGDSWVEKQKLTGSLTTSGSGFSAGLGNDCLRGDVLVVPAPDEQDLKGAVYFFLKNAETDVWEEKQHIQPPSLLAVSRFGWTAALSNDGRFLAVCAFNAMRLYLFNRVSDRFVLASNESNEGYVTLIDDPNNPEQSCYDVAFSGGDSALYLIAKTWGFNNRLHQYTLEVDSCSNALCP